MGSNLITLTGIYKVQGTTLTQPDVDFKLVITTRKHPTLKKPKQFIVAKPSGRSTFTDGSNYVYVSSLYPRGEDVFSFDFEGKTHLLTMSGTSASISHVLIS